MNNTSQTKLTELIASAVNVAIKNFNGKHRNIKGFHFEITEEVPKVDFIVGEIPQQITDLLIAGPETAAKEEQCKGVPYLGFYFNFHSADFTINKQSDFFIAWDYAFERWKNAQDERIKAKMKCDVSEVVCIKTGEGLIHVIMKFSMDEIK